MFVSASDIKVNLFVGHLFPDMFKLSIGVYMFDLWYTCTMCLIDVAIVV